MFGVCRRSNFALLYVEVGGWLESGSNEWWLRGECGRCLVSYLKGVNNLSMRYRLLWHVGPRTKGGNEIRVWLGMVCLDLKWVECTWFVI